MAGRHLKQLLAAHRDRDDLAFRRAATSLIEEEEGKRHHVLARDLRQLLASGSGPVGVADFNVPLPDAPRDRESSLPLADVTVSDRWLADLVLDGTTAGVLGGLVAEVSQWPVLDSLNVPRRNKLLLYGPPGCGKTSIAEALAAELGRALDTVRVDSVVSSFLGETASNLRRIFEFARTGAFVVLFDEFDSLAKDREDPSDHGELRRVVNAMLQLIDQYQGPSILIAATNHSQVLDSAMWRRFDEVVEVGLPDRKMVETMLRLLLRGRSDVETDVSVLAAELAGLPHAAVERCVYTAVRLAVANGRHQPNRDDLARAVEQVRNRRWM